MLKSFIWSFSERMLSQIISTVVGILLARILLPEQYGVVSIVMVFINLCDVFVNSGFGAALVQKKTVDSDDYGTAFSISLTISLILYIILYFSAPLIAEFYNIQLIRPILRVMGLRIIIASFNNIQQAYIQRNMQFKLFFISTSVGTLCSGLLGVSAAYLGLGAWSLVIQYLSNSVIDTIVLNITGKIKIKLAFDRHKAKEIFDFGSKVLGSSIVYTLDSQIRSMAIGKVFGSADLAFYDQGNRYPALLVTSVNSAMQKVLLPSFSRKQDDNDQLRSTLRKCIRFSMFVLAPLLIGFGAVADTFVTVVLTDKWIDAIPFIRLFCIYYLTRPFESTCHQALLAKGRSDIVLKVMILIDGTGLILALIAIFYFRSALAVAQFLIISTIISIICFSICTQRVIQYSYKEQLDDVLDYIVGSVLMGVIIILVGAITPNNFLTLILQVAIGIISYYLYVKMRGKEELRILSNLFKKKRTRSAK